MPRPFLTEAQLAGRHGFSEEDYSEFLKRKIARREDIQAHELTLQRAADVGAMERTERGEVGATKRLGMEHEFRKPEQAARIGEIGTRTAAGKYELGFKREVEPTVKSILEQEEELGGLDIKTMRKKLRQMEIPEEEVSKEVATPTVPSAVAKPTGPRRKLHPTARKVLWGQDDRTKFPGLLAPIRGWYNLAQWANYLTKQAYEGIYPKTKTR